MKYVSHQRTPSADGSSYPFYKKTIPSQLNQSRAKPPRRVSTHAVRVASVYSNEILNVFPKLSAILWRKARDGL